MFVTDDREAGTLLTEGHINAMVARAVQHGLSVADAVKLASLNVARYHGLSTLGAIAPGYQADVVVLPDLERFRPQAVFRAGVLVAENGETVPFAAPPVPPQVTQTVSVKSVSPSDLRIQDDGSERLNVVELIPDQVVTRAATSSPTSAGGAVVADPGRDLAKVAVVERHRATGRIGLGFVRGFGLQDGAFASTVAHDAHNLVVVGVNDLDMVRCVEHLAIIGGGLVVVRRGEVLGDLPLEIAGLMSTQSAEHVAESVRRLEAHLEKLGVHIATPFMYLSFLALSVIPELRITDHGVVDVRSFQVVPLGAT